MSFLNGSFFPNLFFTITFLTDPNFVVSLCSYMTLVHVILQGTCLGGGRSLYSQITNKEVGLDHVHCWKCVNIKGIPK